MTDPAFTILLPIVRPPDLMEHAIGSVLNQTRRDFELFIICDGAPAETVAASEAAAKRDGRIRAFSFPKGERHGEAHRHIALDQAKGRYVCHIADDDLWFPEHLEEMAALLAEFEFGHVLEVHVLADKGPLLDLTDLADPGVKQRMLEEKFYRFGPTTTGYHMATYRRLPVGWSPAPQGFPTDLFMWRKFLALPDLAAGTRFVATSVHFPTPQRRDWPIERRREEMTRYSELIASQAGRDKIREQAFHGASREYMARFAYMVEQTNTIREQQAAAAALHVELASLRLQLATARVEDAATRREVEGIRSEIASMRSSLSWRLTAPLRRLKN